MKKGMERKEQENREIMVLAKSLAFSYIVTAAALLLVAFLLYKAGLSEKTVSVCMILIYAGAAFIGGFLAGKELKKMKFLWGLIVGLAYFVILVVMSLIGQRAGIMFTKDFFTTLLLCAGGGMLGGMVS